MFRMMTTLRYLTFALLLVASATGVEARENSYLFRLTDVEINEIMGRYYPRGYDRDGVLRQMSEPFDCRNFGELCDEVGADYAYRIVESAWSKGRLGFPLEMISRAMESDVESYGLRWFERSYPLGLPDKDSYWGQEMRALSGGAAACSASAFAESGSFRVVNKSSRVNAGLVVWGRVKVEHFKRSVTGNWNLDRANYLEVDGTVYLTVGNNDTAHPIGDAKNDAKRVAATFVYGGTFSGTIPFVEGCGGVGPGSSLWACSCSGALPSFFQ